MTLRHVTVLALTAGFLLIYVPDVGHGFLRDDFMWVRTAQITSAVDLSRIVGGNTGFYRPLVTLSFGVNRWLSGLNPFPYALTNLLLVLLCAVLVARLARTMGLASWAAIAAGSLWAFNVHGINMSVLWLSGRTALLLCLCSLMAMLSAIRQRWWQAGAWCLLALLSKEEAVLLPVLLVAWRWYATRSTGPVRRRVLELARLAPIALAVVAYAALRANSDAFGPASAPSYYRFSFAPALVLRNVFEYADRALTFPAAALLVTFAAARRRPTWQPGDLDIVVLGVLWLVAGYALTVFLPVRSSLYALFPSIGAMLIAGLVLQRLSDAAPARVRPALALLLALPFLLLPVYRQRNARWVEPADASRLLVSDLQQLAGIMPPGTHLIAIDTPDQRLDSVFSGLFGDAVALYIGPEVTGEIVSEEEALDRRNVPRVRWLRLQPNGHFSMRDRR